jgi:hypothetical protein
MATTWGINDQKSNQTELFSWEWNHLVRTANTQTQAALEAQGAGVVFGLQAVADGPTTVSVGLGLALVQSAQLGFVALKSAGESLDLSDFPDLEPDGENYLLATILEGIDVGEPDSRESGIIQWVVSVDTTVDGGTPIALIHTAAGTIQSIEDKREYSDLPALASRVTALENAVSVLQTQVEALQNPPGGGSGGGSGGSDTVYLSATKWSPIDTRFSDVVVEEMIEEAKAEMTEIVQTGGQLPADSRLDLYAHRQAVLIHKAGEENPEHTLDFEGAYIQRGLFGEGSGATENHIVLTTMTETDRGWEP